MNVKKIRNVTENLSVMLIEDNDSINTNLTKMLEKFFKVVFSFVEAEKAISYYQENKNNIDLIVTDYLLPNKSGLELIKEIREINDNQKFLMISAFGQDQLYLDLLEIGVEGYMSKPLNMDEFIASVYKISQKIDLEKRLHKTINELKESKECIEGLLECQDRFIKDSVHEIKTPLAIMLTNVELAELDGFDNEYTQTIKTAVYTLNQNFDNLSYFIKVKKEERIPETIDFSKKLQERISYFKPILRTYDFEIAHSIENGVFVYMDTLELVKIIDNTISNAIKYSTNKEIGVHLETNDGKIIFWVENTGAKILNAERIFERYYRESNHKGGYGIGLAIVKDLCEKNKIDLKLERVENKNRFLYILEQI